MGEGGVKFDKVDLSVIGDNGSGPKPVADELEELIQRASHDVAKDGYSCEATIALTVKVTSPDGGASFKISHDVKYTPPRRKRSVMVAFHNPDGVMVTQDHKQMTMSNVVKMGGDK
jgi:hypothetical protein